MFSLYAEQGLFHGTKEYCAMVTLESLRAKRVVVYGTGINAVKCVSFLERNGIDIEFMVDGKEGIGSFKNYPVYKPISEKLHEKYIVVASAYQTYPTIKNNLKSLKEFENFIYYGWLDKKIVFLHGNCHMDVIEGYLKSSDMFNKEYTIYPTPRICTKERISEEVLKYMDVWIHEDIRSDNSFGYEFSDEYIKRYVASDIKEIVMPHLYNLGAGFFPHAKERNDKNTALLNGAYENGMFPYKDGIIDRCLTEHMSLEKICEYVMMDDILPAKDILDNFDIYIEKIKKREMSWDIRIGNFILENYKKQKLFYDMGHPTNVILKRISIEILKHLKIFNEDIETDTKLDYHEVPIYPWIRKVLNMEWDEKYIRIDDKAIKCTDTMDIAEYVKEYIWWCYT